MFDLPQITIPAILYNGIICGLVAALAWHALSMVQAWTKRKQA